MKISIILVASLLFIHPELAGIHRKFFSYFENSDHDNITNIIQRHVGGYEIHKLHTEDGYILQIFRLPQNQSKGVIVMQHPVFFDARIWVSQHHESIAFYFWKAGYDVWLGNTRGNYYCKEHANFTSKNVEFWDFSFHEMGYYDNHAIVQHIRNVSQEKIIYLGFSLSGSTGLVYASTRSDEVADSVKLMIVMAPSTHLKRSTSLSMYITVPFFWLLNKFHFIDFRHTIFRHDIWYLKMARFLLRNSLLQKAFIYFICAISGWTPNEMDPNLITTLISNFGSEVPLKVFNHFYQLYTSGGNFHMYDYGDAENLKLYGNRTAPLYPLGDVQVPVYVVHGQSDSVSCVEDVDVLYRKLPKNSTIYGKLMAEGLNHADFTYGRHRFERVYWKILKLLETLY